MPIEYWFWRYLQDFKWNKKSVLHWYNKWNNVMLREMSDRVFEDYSLDILSDTEICYTMYQFAKEDLIFHYDVDERWLYKWRYERKE